MARSQRPAPTPCKRPAANQVAPRPKRPSGGKSTAKAPTAAGSPAAKRRKTASEADSAPSAPRQGRQQEDKLCEAMDLSRAESASNSPSEDADTPHGTGDGLQSRQRPGSGPSDLGGALSFFMKRAMDGSDGSPAPLGFPAHLGLGSSSSSSSQFSPLLRDLRSEDGQRQLMALTELAEQLSFSSEEALISFPMETFIPLLVNLLGNPGIGDETTAQVMLLSCRCLYNVVDILPPTARIIVGAGGLPVLCANLLNIEYIDVAELTVSIIEQISEDQPLQVLRAGGLEAILTFLDFFQMSVQRQAANAAALMLLPVLPSDVFEQHVKPALPTLAQLLQHSDPQVLHSVCESWRRVIDGCISSHERPRGELPSSCSGGGSAASALVSRFAAQARLRFGAEGSKREADEAHDDEDDEDEDEDDEDEDEESAAPSVPPSPAGPPVSAQVLTAVLQDVVPSSVLGNLLLLLGNGISSPSQQTSSVLGEVLYILSVLTNYSDNFTEEVLQQDICGLLRQMVLGMDLVGSGASGSSQASSGLIRVLALIASVLPSLQLTESGCACEEKRMAVLRQNPNFLDALTAAFLPLLLDICEASMDPAVQSICISLLLTFAFACRERPELLRQHLEPTQLASFMANQLLMGASSSVSLACLLIVEQVLEHCQDAYVLHFVRQGVLHAVQGICQRPSAAESLPASAPAAPGAGSGNCCLRKLCKEVAQRVISTHFASPACNAELHILKQLEQVAQQLPSSPDTALPALRELLLGTEGVTAFELTCSGVATALCSFLFPDGCGQDTSAYRERLRLFLECLVTPPGGTLMKLVKLCVSALSRAEQQPLALFPTASPAIALPKHLWLGSTQSAAGDGARAKRGELPPGFGMMRGAGSARGSSAGSNSSPLLSVLRLLGKPVKVRMGPNSGQPSSGLGPSAPNFRSLLGALSGERNEASSTTEGSSKAAAPKAAPSPAQSGGSASSQPAPRAPAAPVSTSPAARFRNYLASKASGLGVTRKRAIPSVSTSVFRSESKPSATSAPSKGPSEAAETEAGGARARANSSGAAQEGGSSGSRLAREREAREHMAQALEAVLLVEPFAQVSALEDYIWDRHGPGRGSSTPAALAARGGASGEGGSEGAARVRLNMKQPPPGAMAKSRARGMEAETDAAMDSSGHPQSPPAVPLDAPLAPPSLQASDTGAACSVPTSPTAASGAAVVPERRKQMVRIFYKGRPLSSKTSVVQVLVGNARKQPPSALEDAGSRQQKRQRHLRVQGSRFLATTEDSSGSDGGEDATGRGRSASRQIFCGSIWGRVHHMTYELMADPLSPRDRKVEGEEDEAEKEERIDPPVLIEPTDFDCLVQCHARVVASVDGIYSSSSGGSGASSPADAGKEIPPKGREEVKTMLQLLSAFHNVCLYDRACTQAGNGQADDEHFHCNSLTSAMLRQLSDPLAVCTGSIPNWCPRLAGACRFLFPFSVRRILHHSCNLGLGRALHHVQQRAVAQHAHSQEAHRRLEGEVSVASVPRQKVRISRQRLLDSAVKVMNLYGAGNALLEVEYVGEVGTGSGPTLEFYAQVADTLRTSEPRLFRQGTPGGMLFPEPCDAEWLRKGEAQAAQQILERFRLLGHMVAKCILDNRLVDVQLHPVFWRSVLGNAPLSQQMIRSVDPELFSSLSDIREMESEKLEHLCVDFTLPGHPSIELRPGGADITLSGANRDEYISRVIEVSLAEAVAPQVNAFRTAFRELLPLETCRIWSEQELASIIVGSSVQDDTFWGLEHLNANIKAQHGYTTESRCFRDLLTFLSELSSENRRNFLMFATGAPSLPIGGFGGLKPPLTVVKKETPPAPLTPDHFMPSVMTCANYFKLPEYSSAEILKQKLELAMREGQSAFLLS
eukprot:TRINITY_DN13378_c0_g3_i1.p1 TRINITY_DN13378_c0_g3~~TRINITY_DN13378_c0_g3_i1.p1  ORF type:complete len:1878 (+),score=391.01 TRINITY_DN13378_c0_g3_i1:126-5759(+)